MPSYLHILFESGKFKKPEALADVTGDFPLDEAVVQVLPEGVTLPSAESFATSDFSMTGCLTARLPEGSTTKYFLKYAGGEKGKIMLEGEYTSLRTIAAICPNLVPHVLGWGELIKAPAESKIYFLVEDFLQLQPVLPTPERFAARIAELHSTSRSPTGKFGFPVTTCDGSLPHPVAWQESWAKFYAELLRSRVRIDAEVCGSWPELETAAEQVASKVVPRLLDGLTWQGKPIEPSLIHGDLWDANVGTLEDGEMIIYDSGAYYAHNEMETGIWRVIYSKTLGQRSYKEAYMGFYPPAEPVEEWDDRNRLYSLKYNLNWSATDPGIITRKIAYNDMCYLCEKYAPLDGIARYDPAIDPTKSSNF